MSGVFRQRNNLLYFRQRRRKAPVRAPYVFVPTAVKFDGSTYLTRSVAFAGAADSGVLSFSFWFKVANVATERFFSFAISGGSIRVFGAIFASGKVRIHLANAGGTVVEADSSTGYNDNAWHHLLFSYDSSRGSGSRAEIYVDNTTDKTAESGSGGNYDFAAAVTNRVGSDQAGTGQLYTGCLSNLWFAQSSIDFSTEANRLKFRQASGAMEDLGELGETPLGSVPILYLRGDADRAHVNYGAGGSFTVGAGTPTNCATTPGFTLPETAVSFDGTTDVSRATNFTGHVTSAYATVSFWVKTVETDYNVLLSNRTSGGVAICSLYINNDGTVIFDMRDSANNPTCFIQSTDVVNDDLWHHVHIAYDSAGAGTRELYIDGVSSLGTNSGGDDCNWSDIASIRFASSNGTFKFNGCVSNFYLNDDAAVLPSTDNLAFRTAAGKPENLGENGAAPSGTAPVLYLRGDADNFLTNYGSGGNLTSYSSGPPTNCATTPWDTIWNLTASLGGDGAISPSGAIVMSPVVGLAGGSTISAAAGVDMLFSATISGDTTFSAVGGILYDLDAALTANGDVQISRSVLLDLAVALTADGAISPSRLVDLALTIGLGGVGNLAGSTAGSTYNPGATLAGVASTYFQDNGSGIETITMNIAARLTAEMRVGWEKDGIKVGSWTLEVAGSGNWTKESAGSGDWETET